MNAFAHAFTGVRNAHFHRSMRQFGVMLTEKVSSGIGFKLEYGKEGRTVAVLYPNKLVEGAEQDVVLGGCNKNYDLYFSIFKN